MKILFKFCFTITQETLPTDVDIVLYNKLINIDCLWISFLFIWFKRQKSHNFSIFEKKIWGATSDIFIHPRSELISWRLWGVLMTASLVSGHFWSLCEDLAYRAILGALFHWAFKKYLQITKKCSMCNGVFTHLKCMWITHILTIILLSGLCVFYV